MTEENTVSPRGPVVASANGAGLEVRIAQEPFEMARTEGVSLVGPGGLLAHITKTVLQTALDTEMAEHLGHPKGDPTGRGRGNHRNGSSAKTVQTEVGPPLSSAFDVAIDGRLSAGRN